MKFSVSVVADLITKDLSQVGLITDFLALMEFHVTRVFQVDLEILKNGISN